MCSWDWARLLQGLGMVPPIFHSQVMKELRGQFLLVRHTCLLLTTLAEFPPAVRRMFMNTNCLCGKIKMLWIFLAFYHMLFYRLQSIYMLRYNKYIIKINECIYCILNFCYVFVIYFMTPTSVNKFIFVSCPPFKMLVKDLCWCLSCHVKFLCDMNHDLVCAWNCCLRRHRKLAGAPLTLVFHGTFPFFPPHPIHLHSLLCIHIFCLKEEDGGNVCSWKFWSNLSLH